MRNEKQMIVMGCILALTIAVGIPGCAGPLLSWRGATVEEQNRIFIERDGRRTGVWETRDLKVDYAYEAGENSLAISGTVTLDQSLLTGFSELAHLSLSLNFLDGDGKVIETQRLRNFSHRRWILVHRLQFENTLAVPENTASMAFSYVGQVRDGGGAMDPDEGSGAIDWDFWEIPRR